MSKIIVISGPTASGKSNLALNLAKNKDIAIINGDSLQIYEGLPILSAQPSADEQKLVDHFLYSYLDYNQNSSVVNWLNLVKETIADIRNNNKIPVIVGGSGMYISKLFDGISPIPEIDPKIRNLARELYDEMGHNKFKSNLVQLGGDDAIDKQRLIRSYEVLKQTNKAISWWQNKPLNNIFSDENFLHINLEPNRESLYNNCNLRFREMLQNGAIEEVQLLLKRQINDDYPIFKTLGFGQIKQFLKQEISQEKMIEIATQKTRNYAKRQLTWFRHQLPNKIVFDNSGAALNFINKNEI